MGGGWIKLRVKGWYGESLFRWWRTGSPALPIFVSFFAIVLRASTSISQDFYLYPMIPLFTPGPDAKSFQRTLRNITDELQAPTKSAGMLFYTYYMNHLDFSRIADRKAHFMIALNVFIVAL